MKNRLHLALALALGGCAVSSEDTLGQSVDNIGLSGPEIQAVLDLVNYPGTTVETLDDRAALDARAAAGIIARRNGPDGVSPSADDQLFTTIAQIDAVAYVGDSAINHLRSYAQLFPAPHAEQVEGVAFAGWEAEAVIWGVNLASVDELDVAAGLDARAAKNLHAKAPFGSVGGMGPIGYVGTSALQALHDHAAVWWSTMHGAAGSLAGTFDGVAFDEAAAETALAIGNEATREQMVQNGVPAPGAAAIVGNRPYTTVAQIAAVGGVGPATMRGLHDYAVSGAWPGNACEVAVTGRTDGNVDILGTLLSYVSTDDYYPMGEVYALQTGACIDMTSAATRQQVLDQVAASGAISWSYPAEYVQYGPLVAGTTRFAGAIDVARDVVLERISDGYWTPSTAEDNALLAKLGPAHDALTAGPLASPSSYYESYANVDAEECSESAVILVDAETGTIWIEKTFPRC